MDKDKQILKPAPIDVNGLYNKYGSMLYGYILEIVKDEKLASKHLVSVYSSLPNNISGLNADGSNMWCCLRQMAKKHLSTLDGKLTNDKGAVPGTNIFNIPDKFAGLMTDVQKHVFCSVYYNTISVTELAAELHISENCVREILKEAINKIKKG